MAALNRNHAKRLEHVFEVLEKEMKLIYPRIQGLYNLLDSSYLTEVKLVDFEVHHPRYEFAAGHQPTQVKYALRTADRDTFDNMEKCLRVAGVVGKLGDIKIKKPSSKPTKEPHSDQIRIFQIPAYNGGAQNSLNISLEVYLPPIKIFNQ